MADNGSSSIRLIRPRDPSRMVQTLIAGTGGGTAAATAATAGGAGQKQRQEQEQQRGCVDGPLRLLMGREEARAYDAAENVLFAADEEVEVSLDGVEQMSSSANAKVAKGLAAAAAATAGGGGGGGGGGSRWVRAIVTQITAVDFGIRGPWERKSVCSFKW